MFDAIKKLFKRKPTAKEQLLEQLFRSETKTYSTKKPFYHEMIDNLDGTTLVRVYERKSGMVVEELTCKSKEDGLNTALGLLNTYNEVAGS